MDYFVAWLTAFVWTLASELPVYALLLHARFRAWPATLLLTLGVNLATHPVFSWWVFAVAPGDAAVVAAEVLIAAVEGALVAMVLWRARAPRPVPLGFLAGVLANGVSYGAGVVLFGG